MPSRKSLTPEQNQRIRDDLNRLLNEKGGRFENNQRLLGQELGVAQGTVSAVARGDQGTSWHIIARLSQLTGEPESWYLHGTRPPKIHVVRDPVRQAVAGSHPDWDAVVAAARREYDYIPEEAWSGAAGISGFLLPATLTVEDVLQLASTWLRLEKKARAQPLSKEAFDAERAKEEEQDRAFETLEESRKRR